MSAPKDGRVPGHGQRRPLLPPARELARLVRAPAALTVPGDVLAGAAATGAPLRPATLVSAASSVCLYWAGMALNDWEDRDLDAAERPERPIPSGMVTPGTALAVACGLTAAGLGLASVAGGRSGLVAALPLTGAVWSYDLVFKNTGWGPTAMATARLLNVLSGATASGGAGAGARAGAAVSTGTDKVRDALPAAAAVGLHTYAVTQLSRHEVAGGPRSAPGVALAAGSAIAIGTALTARRAGPARADSVGLLSLAYLAGCAPAQLRALRTPSAPAVRRAVGAGIHGLLPLQGALIARAGSWPTALAVAAGYPLARRLSLKTAVT